MNNSSFNDYKISEKELQALKAIEKLMDKPFERVDQVTVDSAGYKLENGKIVGIGLNQLGLACLPSELVNMKHLQTLYLERNRFKELPDLICSLKNLKILNLRDNGLVKIPKTIGNLKELEILILDSNKLLSLPNTIGNLIKLKSLQLNGNRMSSLPESIGQLVNLTMLAFAGNYVVSLPESLSNLEQLRMLAFDMLKPELDEKSQFVVNSLGKKGCKILARKPAKHKQS
ncbi:MAG: leucine-rich repeat domain-containing protein [Candidatus Hodarchaeales archaeon]